jgi:hypothetical protein
LGAGASIPAGLEGIDRLTEMFEDHLKGEPKNAYDFIKEMLRKEYSKVDLEHILEQLNEFIVGPRETSHLFYSEKDERIDKYKQVFPDLMQQIKVFLREKLEVKYDVDYLIGLKGFFEGFRLDIFTLNYDSVIETFCEKESIDYTDGFELGWNPKIFVKEGNGVNLYKLHGSLYWFRTDDGKLVKIPLKYLLTNKDLWYYTDEKITESMIYPATIKEMEATPYSYLRETFKSKLLNVKLIVVVGYSFRDKEILTLIQEQFRWNKELWLLVVDLDPDTVKARICGVDRNLIDRTVTLQINVKQAFGQKIINNTVNGLQGAIQQENRYLSMFSRVTDYDNLERELLNTEFYYENIGHFTRIKLLVEQFLSSDFAEFNGPSVELATKLFRSSLKFGLVSVIQGDWMNAELWFQIFGGLAIHDEYYVICENDSDNAIKNYEESWKNARQKEIPWSSYRKKLINFADIYSVSEELTNLTENEIREKVKAVMDSIKSANTISKHTPFIDVNKLAQAKREIIQSIGSIGFIYSVPQLLDFISSKRSGTNTLLRKWDPTKLC